MERRSTEGANVNGELGWAADLLAQVAEGVVGYFRRTFQDHKFRAVASALRVEIQLISEANSLMTSTDLTSLQRLRSR